MRNLPRVLEDCKLIYPSDYVPTSLLKSLRAVSDSKRVSCCTRHIKEVTAVLAERKRSQIGQVSVTITSIDAVPCRLNFFLPMI